MTIKIYKFSGNWRQYTT